MSTFREPWKFEKLRIIFELAKTFEKQMSEFILLSRSHGELLKKFQDLHQDFHMSKFRKERTQVLTSFNFLPDEHEASMLIISLGKINTKFNTIEKSVAHTSHKTDFFKNSLTDHLKANLRFIREELYKLDPELSQINNTKPIPLLKR